MCHDASLACVGVAGEGVSVRQRVGVGVIKSGEGVEGGGRGKNGRGRK